MADLLDDRTGSDPFSAVNRLFRESYAGARAAYRRALPVTAMTLIGTGEVWRVEQGRPTLSYPADPDLVRVKTLLHAIVAVFGWVEGLCEGQKAREQAGEALSRAILDVQAQSAWSVPQSMAEPIQRILNALVAFCSLKEAGMSPDADAFSADMAPLRSDLEAVIDDSGRSAEKTLRANLKAFWEGCSPEARADCLICVCGPAQGRRDNLEYAVVEALFGHNFARTRFFYLENVSTIEGGIEILSGLRTEQALGRVVFGDAGRMWRDLLGGSARRLLGRSDLPRLGE